MSTLRAKLAACQPYLKDGETPAECIERNRRDIDVALGLLAAEKQRSDVLRRMLRSIRRDATADHWHRAIDTALATYHRAAQKQRV